MVGGYDDVRQFMAIGERVCPDVRDAVRDCDTRQGVAGGERGIPDGRDAVRDRDTRQGFAAAEHVIPDGRDAVRDRDARQGVAPVERGIPDDRDAVRDRDARQGVAVVERLIPDGRHAVRDRDARQGAAPVERGIPDHTNALRDRIAAVHVSTGIADERLLYLVKQYAVYGHQRRMVGGYDDVRQFRAIGERVCPDGRDAVRDRDARQGSARVERGISDDRDGIPVNSLRNRQFFVPTGVIVNLRRAILQQDIFPVPRFVHGRFSLFGPGPGRHQRHQHRKQHNQHFLHMNISLRLAALYHIPASGATKIPSHRGPGMRVFVYAFAGAGSVSFSFAATPCIHFFFVMRMVHQTVLMM